MTKDKKWNDLTKHIDINCQTVIDHSNNDRIGLKGISSERNVSDIMTKALGRVLLASFTRGMGMYVNDQ